MIRVLIAICVCVSLLVAARPARAGEPDAKQGREQRAVALIKRGIGLLDAGRYDQAELLFREAVKLVPEKGAPHFFLGKAIALQGRCVEAIPELERYLELTKTGEMLDEAATLLRQCRPADARPVASTTTGGETPVEPDLGATVPAPTVATWRQYEVGLGMGFGYTAHTPAGADLSGSVLTTTPDGQNGLGVRATLATAAGRTVVYSFAVEAVARRKLLDPGWGRVSAGVAFDVGVVKFDPDGDPYTQPDDSTAVFGGWLAPELTFEFAYAPRGLMSLGVRIPVGATIGGGLSRTTGVVLLFGVRVMP